MTPPGGDRHRVSRARQGDVGNVEADRATGHAGEERRNRPSAFLTGGVGLRVELHDRLATAAGRTSAGQEVLPHEPRPVVGVLELRNGGPLAQRGQVRELTCGHHRLEKTPLGRVQADSCDPPLGIDRHENEG